ncbi:MAG: type IX secretion system outer membrane channel protein PorV [Mangrovibacterium sp.]
MQKIKQLFTVALVTISFTTANAQDGSITVAGSKVISSAVPFLTVSPDARSSAMGDAGVATTPDANAQHWNLAKYSFIDQKMGLSVSYSPWLRDIVDDMNISYVSFFRKIGTMNDQAISASLRYFSLGSIVFFDQNANLISQQNPNELSIDFGYSRKLSETWSGGVSFRYIRSDLATPEMTETSDASSAANAVAVDVAFYHRKEIGGNGNAYSLGFVASNIGTKVSYDDGNTKNFLPANLRVGAGYELSLDENNKFNFALDFNKLMVPTSNYDYLSNSNDGSIIIQSKEINNYSTMGGIFRSFTDAPGGFKEEMQEITTSIGVEYWYSNQFALRSGFFTENKNKGGRQFLTFGAGAKMYGLNLDVSYLVSTASSTPLANTLRFSLGFNFDELF